MTITRRCVFGQTGYPEVVKIFLIAILVAVVMGALGVFGGIRFEEMRHARQDIERMLQSQRDEQHYAAVISLGVLDTLEAGETEKAKSLLARQIALYHRAFKNYEGSLSDKQRLVPLIDEVSSKSVVLREELRKESQ